MQYEALIHKREHYQANRHRIPQKAIENHEAAFRVEYAHNSTAIEGNTLSLIEAKLLIEDGISVGGKNLREIYEVVNHVKAYDYILQCLTKGKPLSEEIVKDVHQILMENILPGGIYRNANVRITGAGFQPPSPNEMYYLVKRFFAELPMASDRSAIEPAAWVHAEFVRIHPFVDGNGRVSRMMMNYQLMSDGWLPVSIAKEDRLRYYEALEMYGAEGDLEPFAIMVAEMEERELDRMIGVIEQVGE